MARRGGAGGDFGVRMRIKDMFFDRPAVMHAVDKATLKNLRIHASRIRKRARGSMKRVSAAQKKKANAHKVKTWNKRRRGQYRRDPTVSKPGDPPRIHTAGSNNPKRILFGYDKAERKTVIGPVRFNTRHNAVEALEKGGRVPVYSGTKRRRTRRKTVTIKPRPFMRPAEEKERGNMASPWADSIRR